MKGCITKYSIGGSSRPRWRYRLWAGKDANGRRIREGRAGFDKEATCRDVMNERIKELRAQPNAPPPATPEPVTLSAWLSRWICTYAPNSCQPKTIERYSQLIRYITISEVPELAAVAQTPLPLLKHAPIESALYALLHAPAKRREHVSARTVRHVAGVVQVALNEAFRLDFIAVNPMLKVKLPPAVKRDARSLGPDEIRALRDACRGDRSWALIEIALATGARRGELLALEWQDLDWGAKNLTISKSLEQTAAGLRIKPPKNGKTRLCSLPETALTVLRFQREQQDEHRRLFDADYHTDLDLVFCQPNGDFHEPDLVSQTLIRRMRKAGIQNASFHTLRHTHASVLLSNGVPLPAVSARLGHADVNITARIYSHALPDDDRRAADAWDSMIRGSVQ